MPSFQDSAVIFLIALLLFGPKELPKLARYIGKLMNEFRRASTEFRMQMEDEFRQAEQAEHQKKIAAMEAAAPIMPALTAETLEASRADQISDPTVLETEVAPETSYEPAPEPLPIATNGDLSLMPPATGLPVGRTSSSEPLGGLFDSIPHTPDPAATTHESETTTHG